MTGIVLLKKFFGLKPGQTLQEFSAEYKALTAEDVQELGTLAAKELGETFQPDPPKSGPLPSKA